MKINDVVLFIVALVLWAPGIVNANKDPHRVVERSTHYKCHLTMQDGTERVNYMMSKPNYAKSLAKSLNGSYIYAKNGVTKVGIREAHECVFAKDQFESDKAQSLDKQTLH